MARPHKADGAMVRVSFFMPQALKLALEAKAKKYNTGVSENARMAIVAWVEENTEPQALQPTLQLNGE